MVPTYGAADLARHGIPAWQVVALAGVANLAVALSGLVLAVTGWQPRWPWVAGAMAVAAGGLLLPLLLPIGSASFAPLAMALAIFGSAAGLAQFAEQTSAVAAVEEEGRRSEAVSAIMRWHLLAGIVFGGIPFFFSWRAGEAGLVIGFGLLGVAVAVRRRAPGPHKPERYGLRRLFRETGSGSAVVAIGQAAWVVMYLLPGLLAFSAAVIAAYAVVAQVVAFVAMARLGAVADRNRALVATISGTALLVAILGVAIFPAMLTSGAGVWAGLACFVAGEVSANFFISAVEGLISVEIGGQRAQLVGHATKFAAVGAAGGLVAILAGILTARIGATGGAIALGAIVVVALGAMFGASVYALRGSPLPR